MPITPCICERIWKPIRLPQSEERFNNIDAKPTKYKDKNKDKTGEQNTKPWKH